MSEEKIQEITRHLGKADADTMIKKLESWGIHAKEVKLLFNSNGSLQSIHIPKQPINDLKKFQDELSILSKIGRSYEIKKEGDCIIINPSVKKGYQTIKVDRSLGMGSGELPPYFDFIDDPVAKQLIASMDPRELMENPEEAFQKVRSELNKPKAKP